MIWLRFSSPCGPAIMQTNGFCVKVSTLNPMGWLPVEIVSEPTTNAGRIISHAGLRQPVVRRGAPAHFPAQAGALLLGGGRQPVALAARGGGLGGDAAAQRRL